MSFIERDQRFSKEWHQAIQMLCVKSPTFQSVAEKMGTASSTVIRRFDQVVEQQLVSAVMLPKAIAIDAYKGDTNAEIHEPTDCYLAKSSKRYDKTVLTKVR
ncbi:transposase family protein [Kurthia sibirica]|uniref:transposase family protein n=1 Tax=Kurthia sibirica TaxID=202750 RepID=UPI0024AEDE6D|nr:transposase family protein [Kurthia sibirica]